MALGDNFKKKMHKQRQEEEKYNAKKRKEIGKDFFTYDPKVEHTQQMIYG